MKQVVLLKSRIASGNGGAEKYTKRLAVAFHRRNCHVTLLTSGRTPKESLCEVISDEWIHPLSFIRTLKFDKFCQKVLPALNADIVFGLDRNRYQTHLRASNGAHIAYLEHRKKQSSFLKSFSFKVNPLHQALLKIEKQSFEAPSLQKLFVNSKMVKDEILHYYHVDPQKISIIHNGVEWEEMENDFYSSFEKKPNILKELNLPSDTFHFLFIGHNYRRKGLEIILQSLSLLPNEDFHLSVVGKEKKLLAFKMLVKALKMEHKVTFFQEQKDVKKFYQFADALLIPSFYDPFANVTVEALAMGLYTVSSKTNGGSEVIVEHAGSVIEDLFQIDAVKNALKKALLNPKTKQRSESIRESIRYLDFSSHLENYVDETLC